MNVLVYSGAEILPLSLTNVLASLRCILFPHYTVQPITQSALTSQPWRTSCALIVLPQFQRSRYGLSPAANKQIGEFVEAGGKFLIFGAKAHIQSRSSSYGLDDGIRYMMIGSEEKEALDLPLRFYDKDNHCYIAFEKEDKLDKREQGGNPHICTLIRADGVNLRCFHETGNDNLVGFDVLRNVSVLARYESVERNPLACLSMTIGEGQLTLLGPSIEYPMTQEPVLSLLSSLSSEKIQSLESSRCEFLRGILQDLGLNAPEDVPSFLSPPPLPQLLTSAPYCSAALLRAIRTNFELDHDLEGVLKDANDEFQFHSFDRQHTLELLASSRKEADSPSRHLKHIVICGGGVLPDRQITPLFDLDAYYTTLRYLREESGIKNSEEGTWGIGEALLYGEVVTSTQTMLDKNPSLLSSLPVPLLSLASHQVAGRGRGSNSWLTPPGCLPFSLLLRVQRSSTPTCPAFPPAKLVFIQYLCALAVVEACRDERVLGERLGSKVRLKWPNDVYADFGLDGKEEFKKVGGILVNTQFEGGKVDIVVGCGLNVLNKPPIPSLALLQELYSPGRTSSLSLESTAAVIMARFESMWNTFLEERSFAPFMRLYLDRWLHSGQRILLTTTNPHVTVRIVGITADHGLLRTVPERRTTFDPWTSWRSGEIEYIDLQPDGNSFDLMAGLIKTKT